jgi:hypothetical protein
VEEQKVVATDDFSMQLVLNLNALPEESNSKLTSQACRLPD